MEDLFSAFHPQNEPFLRMVWRRVAWSATMPVCSRPLSACEPVRPSSGGPQWPSPRARTVPSGLRAHPPLVWRPSVAISAGSHCASRPASPSGPRLAALSGHLCGLAPCQPPCEPVRPSSGGPQRPSPRARAAPAALRARPPLVRRPSAAISAGSRRAIPPCHSICETINAKVFCSPEAIKRIMCIYILCFCPSDMSANTKRRVHKH